MKILVLSHAGSNYNALATSVGFELVDNKENADVVMFTGGEDINPALYGETPWPETSPPNHPRDAREKLIFEHCIQYNKPMIGICRGAQLLCALSGGKLLQHVEGHGRTHNIRTNKDAEFPVTSTHHQIMQPQETEHVWLASGPWLVPEVVYFPKTKSLCFQYHPEYMPEDSGGRQYFVSLVKEYIYA